MRLLYQTAGIAFLFFLALGVATVVIFEAGTFLAMLLEKVLGL